MKHLKVILYPPNQFKPIVSAFLVGLCLLPNAVLAALNLNGVALYSELGKDQFIAGLYVEDLSKESKTLILSDQRKHMVIKVLADRLLSRKFQRQWIEGVAINAGNRDLTQQAQNLADFSNMLKVKLIKNDTLTIERTFRRGVIISINGVTIGSIADKNFFDLLLRTWIGPVPPSSNFKESLLQGGSIESDLLAKFDNVRTTPQRVNDLTLAITKKNNQQNKDLNIASSLPQTEAIATLGTATLTTTTLTTTTLTTKAEPTNTDPVQTSSISSIATSSIATSSYSANSSFSNALPLNNDIAKAGDEARTISDATLTVKDSAVTAAIDTQGIADENNTSEINTSEALSNTQIATIDNKPKLDTEPEFNNQIINNDIFDDEDDSFSYTAADLLSRQLYISKLTKWTGEKVTYPKSSLRKNEQGTVRIAVVINKQGKVINQEITSSSDFKALDKAAQKAIKSASPYPAVPDVLSGETFEFTVPIVFSLRPNR